MTELSLPLRDSFLLSPRTASYIDALTKEGDKFDYSKWLQWVREGEAQAKRGPTTFISEGLVAAGIGDQTGTPDGIWPAKLTTRAMPIPRVLRQTHRAPKRKAPEISIRHRLEKIRYAWDGFQASRARDAVYRYLEAVLAIVEHNKVRRRVTRLRRHAFKFANLPLNNRSDLFTAIIRFTSRGATDNKTISKWARALRYVTRCKVRQAS
jgi:hypothetical protein